MVLVVPMGACIRSRIEGPGVGTAQHGNNTEITRAETSTHLGLGAQNPGSGRDFS